MADKSWDEKMKELDAGRPVSEVHEDPNPGMKFTTFGDESDDPESPGYQGERKGKGKAPKTPTKSSTPSKPASKPWTTTESLQLLQRYVTDTTTNHRGMAKLHSESFWGDENIRSMDATRQEFAKQIGKGNTRESRDAIKAAVARLEEKKRAEAGEDEDA